jgi:uracil-DNA glycosylase
MKLTKLPPKKKKGSWVDEVVKNLRNREGITRLQGNPNASILLIGPVPTQVEIHNNLAWCDQAASRFFTWMENEHDLKSNQDFLIMPTTFDADKPKKGNTDIGMNIVEAAAEEESIERMICIGGDAFKTYFGFGRKPSMESLVGNVMFLQQSKFKPVFVFPDLNALRWNDEMKFKEKRDFYKAMYACQYWMKYLDKLSKRFKTFLKTDRPNVVLEN